LSILLNKKNVLFAIFYSLVIVSIPWEIIRGYQFEDYLNYIARIHELEKHGESYINPSNTVLGAFISEILWGYLLLGVANSDVSAEFFLTIMSFFCLFTISYYVFSNVSVVFGVVFLTNPLIVDFIMSQHRNAFAFSLFLYALMYDKKIVFYLTMMIAALIHTASLLLFPSYICCQAIVKSNLISSFLLKKTTVILIGVFIGLVLSIGREIILGSIGDRRAEYDANSVSLVYAVFWFCILVTLLLFYKVKKDSFYYYAVLNLVIFSVLTLLNSYSSRFLVLAYPFIIICIYKLKKDFALSTFALFLIYQFLQWIFWFGIEIF
jgi:hypothetical protein